MTCVTINTLNAVKSFFVDFSVRCESDNFCESNLKGNHNFLLEQICGKIVPLVIWGKGVIWGNKGLYGVIRGYKGLSGVIRVWGNKGLYGVIRGYKGL